MSTDVSLSSATAMLDPEELARLIDQARCYEQSARSESTRRNRALHWRAWQSFCTEAGILPMPADPAGIAVWLVREQAAGLSIGTLQQRLVAISAKHREADLPSPLLDPQLRDVWRGMRRTHGTAPKEAKAPLLTADIRALLQATDPKTVPGARDRALLLVGFAGALRRSELVALDAEDLTISPRGLILTLRRSKTDQEGQGQSIAILPGRSAESCPVTALTTYLEEAGIKAGPVFRQARKGGRLTGSRLTGQSVALIIKRLALAAGLEPSAYAGHSLRAGFATQAAIGGAEERRIMQTTRHRKTEMVRRYIRDGEIFRENASGNLGL